MDEGDRKAERPLWVKVGLWGAAQPDVSVGVLLVVPCHCRRVRRLRLRGQAVLHRRHHGVRGPGVVCVHPLGGSARSLVVKARRSWRGP